MKSYNEYFNEYLNETKQIWLNDYLKDKKTLSVNDKILIDSFVNGGNYKIDVYKNEYIDEKGISYVLEMLRPKREIYDTIRKKYNIRSYFY